MEGFNPVADGWRDTPAHPHAVYTDNDHFFPDTVNVIVTFDEGPDKERPMAKLPLVYSPDHIVRKWVDGVKTENKATPADQREAYAVLGRIFPKWAAFCKCQHTASEKLNWFNDHQDEAREALVEYQVYHSGSGFCNAKIKDPANAKARKPREKVSKASVISRAEATLNQFFGTAAQPAPVQTDLPAAADDSDIPF